MISMSKRIVFTVTDEMGEAIARGSAHLGYTQSECIRMAVRSFLDMGKVVNPQGGGTSAKIGVPANTMRGPKNMREKVREGEGKQRVADLAREAGVSVEEMERHMASLGDSAAEMTQPKTSKILLRFCQQHFEKGREYECRFMQYTDNNGNEAPAKWMCINCVYEYEKKIEREGGKLREIAEQAEQSESGGNLGAPNGGQRTE